MSRTLAKPEPRARLKRRAKRVQASSRRLCRVIVFKREQSCCERCGRFVTDDCEEWAPQRAHVNEKVPKSRGGSSVDPDNCELTCQACHMPNGQHAPTAERMRKIQARTVRFERYQE